MKRHKLCSALILFITLSVFTMASTVFAAYSTSPAKGAASGVSGLKIEGQASGTKLTGVIFVSFSNIRPIGDPNTADARVFLRLSQGNLSEDNTKVFYADLGAVFYKDVASVQTIAIEKLRPQILNQFFAAPLDAITSDVKIYLKDISFFFDAALNDSSSTYSDYAAVADLTLAVNY